MATVMQVLREREKGREAQAYAYDDGKEMLLCKLYIQVLHPTPILRSPLPRAAVQSLEQRPQEPTHS